MDSHLLRFNSSQKYLIFDFETESLNLCARNYPWNLGFLVWQNGKILEQHEYCPWWPDLNVSPGAAKVTRFDYKQYKSKAEDAKKILEIFESYLYNSEYIPLGHNTHSFDAFVHNLWRRESGLPSDYSYLSRSIDTNSLAKLIKLGIKELKQSDWLTTMFRMAGFKQKGMKTNLTALGKERLIDVDYDALHESLNDCILNALVWEKLKWEIEI